MKHLILIFTIIVWNISFAQTKDSVFNYLKSIDTDYPDIVLKQAILETGHFKSYSSRVRHNLFGLTRNSELETFSTWQESCDKYVKWIQYKYKGGCYYEFLTEIGYATDVNYITKLKSIKL